MKQEPHRDSSVSPEPLTLEGAAILHQMVRLRWPQWKQLASAERRRAIAQASELLSAQAGAATGQSALFSLLGAKGDLMLVHFRKSLEELRTAQLAWTALGLWDFCEYTSSYLSVVELGLYEFSLKLYTELAGQNLAPGSEGWNQRVQTELVRQRELMASRLYPAIPRQPYLCFYPMDKRRGEQVNWYELPLEQRQALMRDHGMIGRKYAGRVTQIISGSIGFDNWEWGVDLFAADPLVFKKLVYEMRFDQASALYGSFGPFFLGIRVEPAELGSVLLAD